MKSLPFVRISALMVFALINLFIITNNINQNVSIQREIRKLEQSIQTEQNRQTELRNRSRNQINEDTRRAFEQKEVERVEPQQVQPLIGS
jgi:cell division protein FtsL